MLNVPRPAPFVLVSTNHGTMIVNRNDYRPDSTVGMAHQLFTAGRYDPAEIEIALLLLDRRRTHFGREMVAVDCGANIGVHSIEWARLLAPEGRVISFEAQEKIYYALAGNIVINNCLNVTAHHAAVGAKPGTINVPQPDYLVPGSFGSLELKKRNGNEFIGQPIDYEKALPVRLVSIDSLNLKRLDFLKIDVEGMEDEVLAGAEQAIGRHRPIMIIEFIKSDKERLAKKVEGKGYRLFVAGMNFLAVHKDDPTLGHLQADSGGLRIG